MASSCKEDVDQVLAGLASMGFELDECQKALQAGHTTIESAVEWLVEKKTKSSATTSESSNENFQENTELSGSGIERQELGSADQQVPSRYAMTDEGRKAKERFVEKEREMARIEAKKRKLEEKKAREQILMQIADDREMRKLKSGIKSGMVPTKALATEQAASTSQSSKTTMEKQCSVCRLQVRLPNSQVRKGSVPVKTTLEQAVSFVCSDSSLRTGKVEILQPFPHRIFTSIELESTLKDLGLCPSAMVVVQKKNVQMVATDLSSDTSSAHVAEPPEPNQDVVETEGDRVGSNNMGRVQPAAEAGLEQIIDDLPRPPGLDIPGLGRHHQQHFWGQGMRLGAVEHNPHAIEAVLEASSPGESATRRMEMRAQLLQHRVEDAAKSCLREQPQLHREVRSLETICIDNIALRLAGHPKLQPITTLGTLPHKVCDKIICQLMKNKALSPKAMQAFLSCCLRYLKLDCYLLVTNELLTALRLHKHLTLLSLKSCPLITDKAMEAVSALKKLQSLNLNQCSQLTDKCFTYIKDLPALTVLQMDNSKVTDLGIQYFVTNASCINNLTHLSLCSTAITDFSLDVLKGVKSLKILGLENTKITKLDVLSGLSHLESLNVSYTNVANSSMTSITGLPCLVSLNILSTAVDDMGLQYLHDLHLTQLKLPGRLNITDQGIQHIQGLPLTALDLSDYINVTDVGVQCISRICSLTKLTLSNTKLTDVGMLNLSGLIQLVELNIDRTAVTDEGCAVVNNFPNLQILSLSSTQITNKLLTCGVLNQCFKLSQLNLSRTQVSNKGIRCLNLDCLTLLNLDWTRVSSDCQLLLTGCPALKALRTKYCNPSLDDTDEDED